MIEDYALLGDGRGAALVGLNGSIDWLCWPRFDSEPACAALLGGADDGHWRIYPAVPHWQVRRRYQTDTLIVETEMECETGAVRLIDFMVTASARPCLVRIVEGLQGNVDMRMTMRIRGESQLCADVPCRFPGGVCHTSFATGGGERLAFMLSHGASPLIGRRLPVQQALNDTQRYWRQWIARFDDSRVAWPQPVRRALLTLKALIYQPSGAMVAAPTTSLPEAPDGLNWDYRYCWVRDASFAVEALLEAGFHEEAHAWRDWLVRTLGSGGPVRVSYCVDGGPVPSERILETLAGWQGIGPVRMGNAAARQYQPDVFGEVLDCLYLARRAGICRTDEEARIAARMAVFVLDHLDRPGSGLWEGRDAECHYTLSRVMLWVALDRFIKQWSEEALAGAALVQRAILKRAEIHAEVCARGWDADRGAFVRSYGDRSLDASVPLLPLVGFLPAGDPRMSSTIDVLRDALNEGGLIRRWPRGEGDAPNEGAFLACSCWMADCLYLRGDSAMAREQFGRVLAVANDVGLLAEEYDVRMQKLVGNFPQALTHLAVVQTAILLGGTATQHRRT